MRSQDVYDQVKDLLQIVATANTYFLIEPMTEMGTTVDTFPLITMEPDTTSSEHGDRGREFGVDITVTFAVRTRADLIMDQFSDIENKIKTALFADRTLAENTKFFDFAVDSRDYEKDGAVVIAWAECTLTCAVTDKEEGT